MLCGVELCCVVVDSCHVGVLYVTVLYFIIALSVVYHMLVVVF